MTLMYIDIRSYDTMEGYIHQLQTKILFLSFFRDIKYRNFYLQIDLF